MDRGGEMYQTGKVHLIAVAHHHSFVLNVYMIERDRERYQTGHIEASYMNVVWLGSFLFIGCISVHLSTWLIHNWSMWC